MIKFAYFFVFGNRYFIIVYVLIIEYKEVWVIWSRIAKTALIGTKHEFFCGLAK